MKKLILTVYILSSLFLKAYSQDKKIPITISIFNNGSSLPGSGYLGIFSKKIHPGFTIGSYHTYHTGEKHELFQTLKLGYFYHRFSQHAIQLYTETGYRYITKTGFYGEVLLGAGYLHSFPDIQIFVLKDGRYVKKTNLGRPQLMITTGLSLGYDFEKKSDLPIRVFILYQFWLQTPFVNNYVPMLPNTALHLGANYKFNKKKK